MGIASIRTNKVVPVESKAPADILRKLLLNSVGLNLVRLYSVPVKS